MILPAESERALVVAGDRLAISIDPDNGAGDAAFAQVVRGGERQVGVAAAEVQYPQRSGQCRTGVQSGAQDPDELVDLPVLALPGRLDHAVAADAEDLQEGRVFRNGTISLTVVCQRGDIGVRAPGDQQLAPFGDARLDGGRSQFNVGVAERDLAQLVNERFRTVVVARRRRLVAVPGDLGLHRLSEHHLADDDAAPRAFRAVSGSAEDGALELLMMHAVADEVGHGREI
ncbi:MAG TPA: hypothetical protein VFG35_09005 [Actinoplanes sp.]|nr:hypothetical protein [Actinoplanes sp.]